MEVSQFFEVGSVPDPDQRQEDEASRVLLISIEPEVQKEQKEVVPQDLQGDLEPETEEEQEVLQDLQGGPEPYAKEQEVILQALQGHLHLEINQMVDPEVQQEYEAPVARNQLRQHIEPNIQQELVHLTENNILQENEVHLNIVPMVSELLRSSWEEARREILQHIIPFNIEHIRFRISNITDAIDITRQESVYQIIHRALLEHISLVRMQFRTSSLLLLEEAPIPLLVLEAPANFLSVEGPPRLLALEGPPPLLALEGPPSKPTKEHDAKKRQQRADPFKPGQPDATLHPAEFQNLLENENQDISDPGVSEFSDPRELSKDLNFGEMKAGYLETEHIGDLEMESIREPETEADEYLETEADEYLETEAGEDLEMEECLPLFPPESPRLNAVIEIPEEPDEVVQCSTSKYRRKSSVSS